jgi:5'-methylthioadenosine phosphorylase
MEGPAFSTRAESLMHRLLGGDLIGMTAMPEARLAREAEMGYALVALVTDYDCWRRAGIPTIPGSKPPEQPQPPPDPAALLKEIIANLKAASDNAIRLIEKTIATLSARREELAASPALQSLDLAIWSDKSAIAREEIDRLAPLWKRHFPAT